MERENLWNIADRDLIKFELILKQSVEQVTELILFKRKANEKNGK